MPLRSVSYCYPLYGLCLCSDTPIPGLWQNHNGEKNSDVLLEIRPEAPPWVRTARDLPSIEPQKSDIENFGYALKILGLNEFFELTYSEGSQFVIDAAGERVWGTCFSPLTMEDLADYIRGPVMGIVLRLRQITALHASVANLYGVGVMFCGASASGKSTIAAALALRGVPVLSEDLAALEFKDDRFYVQPGYPRICLWGDSVEGLLGTADTLSQTSPVWDKRYLPLDGTVARFEPLHKPLAAIYVLGQRTELDAPRIEHVNRREALLSLVQNSYVNNVLRRNSRASEFDVLSKVVMKVPIRRIVPHTDVATIKGLCELILTDVQELTCDESGRVPLKR